MALGLTPQEIVDSGQYPLLAKAHHWERVPLVDVATVQNGFAFKSAFFDRFEGVPLIRIRDISKRETEHKYTGAYDEAYVVEEGQILVGMDGDFLAARWSGDKALLNQRVCRLEVETALFEERFFFLCLQPYLNAINAETSSITVKHLSSRTIENIPLPLPPVNEQKRLVAKIEELFSELDKGIEALKTAQAQLKVYRQALLEGILVDLPKTLGLETKARLLSDLITPIRQGWSPKCDPRQVYDPEGWAIIKTTVVQPMQYLGDEFKPLPPTLDPRQEIEVKAGDFLMTRKGPRKRTGVTCLVRETAPRLMVCDTVYKFQALKDRILPDLLEVLLNAPSTLLKIEKMKSGINDSGVSLTHKKLYALSFAIPTALSEQQILVDALAEKWSVIDQIESDLENQIEKSEALRQSILKKAFSGQLVPQDPSDESASKLLERIKAEKAKAVALKKPQRKKAS